MAYQAVFQRHELKYLITKSQKNRILEVMQLYMTLDKYGRTTIQNIYFDTENYRLIRRSIEKPLYKEKIRIRSYSDTNKNSEVFVEIKKKYKKVVYKRRISLMEDEAMSWLKGECECSKDTQITKEIDYFLSYYGKLQPAMFLSYEREAYYCIDGSDFRITFDENILCRQEDMSFQSPIGGIPILEEGKVLMELKCSSGIPLWLTEILSKEHIYKTSFSKYGTAYQKIVYKKMDNQTEKENK